jgi:uncharacterized membrane protein YsdA (DUF1294 family)
MSSSRPGKRGGPWLAYGLLFLLLAIVLAGALYYFLKFLDPILAWVVAVSLVAFLAYGYDKALSKTKRTRVPERVLLFLVLIGGTLGAVAGMVVFRHKTAKGSFRLKLLIVMALQVALIAVYYGMIKPYSGSL